MTLFVRNFLLIIVLNLLLAFQNYILSENIRSTLHNLLACKFILLFFIVFTTTLPVRAECHYNILFIVYSFHLIEELVMFAHNKIVICKRN
jgi:hypothetical protein